MFNFFKKEGKVKKKSIWQRIGRFWVRSYGTFFFLIFIGIFAYGCLLWYKDVYHFQWDPSERQNYILSKQTQAVFKADSFRSVIKIIGQRKSAFEADYTSTRDVFVGN